MTTKIIIRERGDDYEAFIEGHPEILGCGKGVNAAIGDLVTNNFFDSIFIPPCDVKIEYEKDYERLKKEGSEMEQKMEQKTESERLKIGQEIICPVHDAQTIDAIDDTVPEQILYVLTCGCIHPVETEGVKKSPSIGLRKGPYNNWG